MVQDELRNQDGIIRAKIDKSFTVKVKIDIVSFTWQEGPLVQLCVPLRLDEVDAAVVPEGPHLRVNDDLALMIAAFRSSPPGHPLGVLYVGSIGPSAKNETFR